MFNALKYTEDLERAGFTSEQAKASLKILIEVMNDSFATKSDLLLTKSELNTTIFTVKSELQADLQAVKSELESSIQSVKSELESSIQSVRSELESSIQSGRSDLRSMKSELESNIKASGDAVTIRLGTMIAIGIGLLATLLKMH